MNPLHEYVRGHLAEHLRQRRVVVWYDKPGDFRPFIEELPDAGRSRKRGDSTLRKLKIEELTVHLVEYSGSYFAVRDTVEPLVDGDEPEHLIVYLAGVERDRKGSPLMELEVAGECYEPQLKRLARNVLRERMTDGAIDDMLASDDVGYADLCRLLSQEGAEASLLRAIFPEDPESDALLARWLVSEESDAAIKAKKATPELLKLIASRLGVEPPAGAPLSKLRAVVRRFTLATEFRSDLRCAPPETVQAVPEPPTKDQVEFAKKLARRLRSAHAAAYPELADAVERELRLSKANLPAAALGSIDTFRFEERSLLLHCGGLLLEGNYGDVLSIVAERERSFWLEQDVARRAQWEAVRRMADLGVQIDSTRHTLTKVKKEPAAWVLAYTKDPGWYRMDQAHRRLEAWLVRLDDDPEAESALEGLRQAYESLCSEMTQGFMRALKQNEWSTQGVLQQGRVYQEVVKPRPRPVAYFLVDAMRYEMGQELAERLPADAECTVSAAVVSLPSITTVGMAALLPGASASFSIVEQKGKLGARIEETFLPDLAARRKFLASREPGVVDVTLDDLLAMNRSRLAKKLDGASLVVVRSQEIDMVGEAGSNALARQLMDTVIDNLARAMRKLAAAGLTEIVLSADHGHLFSVEKDESMRIDSPGGAPVEVHRRCWIGRGGTTPPGCVRVTGAELGYESDLDFVFPSSTAVFRAGGDLAYHHGGVSLQEMIVPVLAVRMKATEKPTEAGPPVSVTGLPDKVTNRIFTVSLSLQGEALLFQQAGVKVRLMLVSGESQVGEIGMAPGTDFDREAGVVTLVPGRVATVALLLKAECETLRVVVQDPATDADLFRSDEIAVHLGVS